MKHFEGDATFSPCGRYRYLLWRRWDTGRILNWVMLNPSTADAKKDDPTIRKCIGFSHRWGYGGLRVLNLFAFRATKPKVLRAAYLEGVDIVGKDNDELFALAGCGDWIAAWGNSVPSSLYKRALDVGHFLRGKHATCLGNTTTKNEPRHPLMLPYDTKRILF